MKVIFTVLRKPLILLSLIFMVACSTQEATDEDYLRGADGEFFGPGLISGDKGSLSVGEVFSPNKKGAVGGATAYDVDLPAMDQKSFEEYERFKKWSRSQQPGSAEAREYQEWKEFQEYRRYKLDESKAK
jgi:hypothetical protein